MVRSGAWLLALAACDRDTPVDPTDGSSPTDDSDLPTLTPTPTPTPTDTAEPTTPPVYEVCVDVPGPPIVAWAWTGEGDQENSGYGSSVASAGDVNGDGFDDVVVTAASYDGPYLQEGAAFVYHGSAAGLGATAAWTVSSGQEWAILESGASAGDVNGDGFDDVVVGAPWYENPSFNDGRAWLYLGSAAGLATTDAWTAEGSSPSTSFGAVVAPAGDVNGDGFDDVLVGDARFDVGADVTTASLFLGSPSGLEASAAWSAVSMENDDEFGRSLASAGDVDGDGYADVVVGAPFYDGPSDEEGGAFVYLGSVTGTAATPSWQAHVNSPVLAKGFGTSVASAGDLNQDGYSDLAVGAPATADLPTEGVYVFLGSPAGLETAASWYVQGFVTEDDFGESVASAGDVNGDGFSDLVVGDPHHDHCGTLPCPPNELPSEGAAYLFLGSAAGLDTDPIWMIESNLSSPGFGQTVASAGDVEGDGLSDILVGSGNESNDQIAEGRAHLYRGTCVGDPIDSDGDTVLDACDRFPGADEVLDSDLDLVHDVCDICPYVPDADQADANGDGVGDACVPLALVVNLVSDASGLSAEIDGAFPFEEVLLYLANSPAGVGPCPFELPAGLCLDIGPGAYERWSDVADAMGHAVVTADLPPDSYAGQTVSAQAVVVRGYGGVKSNAVQTTVTP